MNELIRFYAKNNPLTRWKMGQIDTFEALSDNKLLEAYNAAFVALIKRAYNKSPFYQSLYREYGISIDQIKDITDISRLPIINKMMIRDQIDAVYNGPRKLAVTGLTSGTTGTPLTLKRTFIDIAYEQAYIRHYRSKYGYQLGQPLLSIRGMLGKSIPYEYFKKANILYLSSPNINASTIEMYHQLVQEFKPVAVEAFPSLLHKFTTELQKKNLHVSIPASFTSSETLLSYQREMIEPYLQTKIYDWYGNAERSVLLAQNRELKYQPMPLYAIHEFQQSCVVSTNLINHRFPLIRYQVDDVVTVKNDTFENQLLRPEVISIEGRASDNLLLKDGSLVGCPDHAFKGVPNIICAQIHQYDVQQPIVVKLVKSVGFNEANEQQLRANFLRLLGPEMELQLEFCQREDLTYTASGKLNLIIKKARQ